MKEKETTIADCYIRAILWNVAETTRSAQPLKPLPQLAKENTYLRLCVTCATISLLVGTVLYLLSRV